MHCMTDSVNQNSNGFGKKNLGRYYEQNNHNYFQKEPCLYIYEYEKKILK